MDIEEVRRLRDAYEAVLDDAEVARSAYHRAVRKLHASGVPLREIADGLGISHQRVHQIVTPADATRGRPKRAVTGAITASVLALVLIAGTIGVLTRDRAPVPLPVEPSATAAPVADGPTRLTCDRFEQIFQGQPTILQNVPCADATATWVRRGGSVAVIDAQGNVLATVVTRH
jgi:hypothetical protein